MNNLHTASLIDCLCPVNLQVVATSILTFVLSSFLSSNPLPLTPAEVWWLDTKFSADVCLVQMLTCYEMHRIKFVACNCCSVNYLQTCKSFGKVYDVYITYKFSPLASIYSGIRCICAHTLVWGLVW